MEVTPRVIMLVRHGDYQQWEYKEDNKKLTPSGKLQAKEAGEALNRMKDLPPIRQIVTSPMIRALESANIILELLPNVTVTSDYELQEGNPDHLPTRDRFDRVYATIRSRSGNNLNYTADLPCKSYPLLTLQVCTITIL